MKRASDRLIMHNTVTSNLPNINIMRAVRARGASLLPCIQTLDNDVYRFGTKRALFKQLYTSNRISPLCGGISIEGRCTLGAGSKSTGRKPSQFPMDMIRTSLNTPAVN